MLSLATVFSAISFASAPGQNSFPHRYPRIPTSEYGPEWQQYFQVTKPLPNATFDLGRNWAGNVAVNRASYPNSTLFFWAFEKESGSLTAKADERMDEAWGIWLNGGPGVSSLVGLLTENGPLQLPYNQSAVKNNYSWDRLADYFWLDQPVGTGFATVSPNARIHNMDDMAEDFWGFVSNLVKVFPSLASRPLYLTGESYAGTYIPYITKAYMSLTSPPTKLAKIAIGNGAMGREAEFEDASTVSLIETHPELINFSITMYEEFVAKSHLYGYDLNLTYPQTGGHFPVLKNGLEDRKHADIESRQDMLGRFQSLVKHISMTKAQAQNARRSFPPASYVFERRVLQARPDVTHQCAILNELLYYVRDHVAPWRFGGSYALERQPSYDDYDVPNALSPPAQGDLVRWLNDPRTVEALHAPTSKAWNDVDYEVFGQEWIRDPSLRPMEFFDELAKNASSRNIPIVIYSGNDDSRIPHWSSEVVIQNTTFGEIQGFTRKPSTEWTTDDGKFAGIVHQERNWTYVLVYGAGHLVPRDKPEAAYVLLREFILGNNRTGLFVEGSKDSIGPDHSKLVAGAAGNVVRADAVVYMGAGMTQSTFVFPSATVAAWDGFMATRWASKHPASSSVVTPTPTFGVLLSLLSAVLFAGWVL